MDMTRKPSSPYQVFMDEFYRRWDVEKQQQVCKEYFGYGSSPTEGKYLKTPKDFFPKYYWSKAHCLVAASITGTSMEMWQRLSRKRKMWIKKIRENPPSRYTTPHRTIGELLASDSMRRYIKATVEERIEALELHLLIHPKDKLAQQRLQVYKEICNLETYHQDQKKTFEEDYNGYKLRVKTSNRTVELEKPKNKES